MSSTFKPAAPFSDKAYTPIPLVAVESNQVAAVGYDAPSKTLAVKFTRGQGHIYHYPNVEAKTHADFMAAESKGTFFGKHIKHDEPGKPQATSRIAGKYTCECGKFELLEPEQIEKIPGQKDDAL